MRNFAKLVAQVSVVSITGIALGVMGLSILSPAKSPSALESIDEYKLRILHHRLIGQSMHLPSEDLFGSPLISPDIIYVASGCSRCSNSLNLLQHTESSGSQNILIVVPEAASELPFKLSKPKNGIYVFCDTTRKLFELDIYDLAPFAIKVDGHGTVKDVRTATATSPAQLINMFRGSQ